MIPFAQRMPYHLPKADDREVWRIGSVIVTPIAMVVSLIGVVVSVLRLISEFNMGESITAIDYIVLGVSVVMFLTQLLAEIPQFIFALGSDPKSALAWEVVIILCYSINIVIDILLLVCATYVLLSDVTPDFEELLRELLTLFVGYISLNILFLAASTVFYVNYVKGITSSYDQVLVPRLYTYASVPESPSPMN